MSPVEFLSALVAPVTAPAPKGEAADASAFEQAVAAVADQDAAGKPAAAPKKPGLLATAKFVAAEVELEPGAAPDLPAAVEQFVAAVDRLAKGARPQADAADTPEDSEAAADVPAEVVAAPDAPVMSELHAAAPAQVQPAEPTDAEGDKEDGEAGLAAVEQTLAALLDRVAIETGASGDADAAERLEAAQQALARVIDQAPASVRPKLEALLARMADAAATAEGEPASAEPADGDPAEAFADATPSDAAPVGAAVDPLRGTPLQAKPVPPSVMEMFRKVMAEQSGRTDQGFLSRSAERADAGERPAASVTGGKTEFAAGSPATESKDASPSTAGPEPAPAEAGQPAATGADAVPVEPAAAGAPAAHAGARVLAAEAARGSPETVAHLSAQILKKLESRASRFDMELHPSDMGRVDVRLTIEADGRLAAQLSFDNPVAAADLRARADELRRQLEQAGFQLSEDALSFAERDGGQGRAFEDARQQFAEGGRARARAFRGGEETAGLADLAPVTRRAVRLGVDVRI